MDFLQTHSFALHKTLIDGVGASHSDGTHSLQRIHWCSSDLSFNRNSLTLTVILNQFFPPLSASSAPNLCAFPPPILSICTSPLWLECPYGILQEKHNMDWELHETFLTLEQSLFMKLNNLQPHLQSLLGLPILTHHRHINTAILKPAAGSRPQRLWGCTSMLQANWITV